MRSNRIVIVALALLAVAAVAATAEDVSVAGAWTMKMTTPRGERTSTLTFVQDGTKLSVTSKSDRGESTGTGSIAGNEIEWSITRETPMGQMTMVYKGKVDGDTMSGDVKMMDNTNPWTATRNT